MGVWTKRSAGTGIFCILSALICTSIASAQEWPCFTGPNHDNTQPGAKGLANEWPKAGPPVVWETKITGSKAKNSGTYASPVVAGGKVFLFGRAYETDATTKAVVYLPSPDVLHCLDANDGHEVWKQEFAPHAPYPERTAWNTPTVDGELVYARGPDGELRALNVSDGKAVWTWPKDVATLENMVKGDGKVKPKPIQGYGISAPALVVDDILIVPVFGGFKAKLVGLDKKTGEQKWETAEYNCWQFSAGNLIPMTLGDRKIVLYNSTALDPKTGKNVMALVKDPKSKKDVPGNWGPGAIYWVSAFSGNKLITGYQVNKVVVKEDGKSVEKSPESGGIACIEFSANPDGTVTHKTLWTFDKVGDNRRWEKSFGGPVVGGDHVYCFFGTREIRTIACLSMADGTAAWINEKPKPQWGHGNMIAADGKILFQNDGTLTMLADDASECKVLGSAKVCGAGWSTPAMVGTRLYIRDDAGTVKCLELKVP